MSKRNTVKNKNELTTYRGPTIVESFLKKKKSKVIKQKNRDKTSLRYFIFNLNDDMFLYKDSDTTPQIKVIHIGRDLTSLSLKLDEDEKNICDWSFGFKLHTTIKIYTLFAKTKEIYLQWIEILTFYFKKISSLSSANETLPTFGHQPKSLQDNNKPKEIDNKSNRAKSPSRFSKFIDESMRIENNNPKEKAPVKEIVDKGLGIDLKNDNKTNTPNNPTTNRLERPSLNADTQRPSKNQTEFFQIIPDKKYTPTNANEILSNNLRAKDKNRNDGGDNLIKKSSFYNFPGDTNYADEIEEITPNNTGKRNNNLIANEPLDNINPDHSKNFVFNYGIGFSKNPLNNLKPANDSQAIEEAKNLPKKPANSRPNESNNSRNYPVSYENIFINKETPNGFEMVVKIPTAKKDSLIGNTIHPYDNSKLTNLSLSNDLYFVPRDNNKGIISPNNSKINISNGSYQAESSKSYSTASYDTFSKNDNKNDKWDTLNKDWTPLIAGNKKIQNYIDRNKTPEIIIKAQKTPTNTLYDEKNLHIKKSDDKNKFSIENLNYCNYSPQLKEISLNDSTHSKSQEKNNSFILRPKKKKEDSSNDLPGDITTLSHEGEKVNVKWRLTNTTENKTAYKILVPEKLLKDQQANRYQKMREHLLPENQYEETVYLGKNKTPSLDRTLGISCLNNTRNMDQPFNPNESLVGKIMKKPPKQEINKSKERNPVIGKKITGEYGDDEYHIMINKTIKLNANTYLYDDYHLPTSVNHDLSARKDYKTFKKQETFIEDVPVPDFQQFHNHFNLRVDTHETNREDLDNNNKLQSTKNKKDPETNEDGKEDENNNPDYINPNKANKENEANPIDNDNNNIPNNPLAEISDIRDVAVRENNDVDYEETVDENGNIIRVVTMRKTVVKVNKMMKMVKGISGIDNEFDITKLQEDKKNEDLSEIDQYYHNVSKITQNSKMDTNENWNSALTDEEV